jgi:hypothetical protein
MSASHLERNGNGVTTEPAGIVVLDRRSAPPAPLLRAFVWCPRRRSALPEGGGARPSTLKLMVGQATLTALDEEDVDLESAGGRE